MKVLVSVGSYERVVYGLDAEFETKDDALHCINSKHSFAIPAHLGMIKSVASCDRFLVSGGTDENIKIFDLRRRRDLGSVPEHSGTITSLAFHGHSHLLSAGSDGAVALFRTSDWECLHVMSQKSSVHSLAIHPTGKLAISVGEKEMFIWNLVAGKRAHRQRISFPAERVQWSPSGLAYALLGDRQLEVLNTANKKTGKAVNSKEDAMKFTLPSRGNALIWLDESHLLVCGEGDTGQVINVANGEMRAWKHGQVPRVKDAQIVDNLLCLGSSSGAISIWSVSQVLQGQATEPILLHQTGLRITCLTATIL